jgi:carbonic anhydrase
MKHAVLWSWILAASLACRSTDHAAQAPASAKPHRSYSGNSGPAHWGDLSTEYALARTGKQQSPIDIVRTRAVAQDGAPLVMNYPDTALGILNNGHTVEEEYEEGGTVSVDGHAYRLAQFHFHSPSEHTIDGRHAPVEMHMVHKDEAGKIAVVAVMIHEGRTHPVLDLVSNNLPSAAGTTKTASGVKVNASKLLPANLASFRYTGSLTTPPCTEGVAWFVLQEPIEASAGQIAAFRRVIEGNNRPTQPLHGRIVTASR